MTDHTRRIVESPLFEDIDGLGVTDNRFGASGTIVGFADTGAEVVFHDGAAESGRFPNWRKHLTLNVDAPATQACLLFMLSRRRFSAKLLNSGVALTHDANGVLDCYIRCSTLAETFAQAFAYVEAAE